MTLVRRASRALRLSPEAAASSGGVEGFGLEGFGLEGFGLEGFGLEGFGLEGFGLEGFGLEGFGLERFGLEGLVELPRSSRGRRTPALADGSFEGVVEIFN